MAHSSQSEQLMQLDRGSLLEITIRTVKLILPLWTRPPGRAFGQAMAMEPSVLLMDEPFSALDAQTRDLLIDDFLALWRRTRVGALYVTHNLTEAVRLADRVVVLSRRPGRVRAVLPIGLDRDARAHPQAAGDVARLHDQLWDLIREEARVADRELIDG